LIDFAAAAAVAAAAAAAAVAASDAAIDLYAFRVCMPLQVRSSLRFLRILL